jgi:hypothetical protein
VNDRDRVPDDGRIHVQVSDRALRPLAAVVMVVIAVAAWVVGKGDPVPDWITQLLIPALSVLVLVLSAVLLVDWLRRRARK